MKHNSRSKSVYVLKRLLWFATGWVILTFGIFAVGSIDDELVWSTWSYQRVSFIVFTMGVIVYWALWFAMPLVRSILRKEKSDDSKGS